MKYDRRIIFLPLVILAVLSRNIPLYGNDTLSFNFDRGLEFYRWGGGANINILSGGSNFRGVENFYLMLRQPPGFPDQWKLSHKFNAYWTNDSFTSRNLNGSLNTEYFSDQAVEEPPPVILNKYYPDRPEIYSGLGGLITGLDNRTIRGNLQMGMTIPDYFGLKLDPMIGIFGERISQNTAVGPAIGFSILGQDLDISGYETDVETKAMGQFLTGRTNRELTADMRAFKTFSDKSSNLFSAGFRDYQREFPTLSGFIDRRKETEYRLGNIIKYNIYEPVSLKMDIYFARRTVKPTKFDESNSLKEISTGIETGIETDWHDSRLSLMLSADGQDQSYPQRRVKGAQYALKLQGCIPIGEDSLRFNGMLSRYSFNVKPEDYNTRDEQRHSYQITHYHDFNEGLTLQTTLRADLYHLVYLKEERSANNNWERFILFSPNIRYIAPGITNSAVFRVSADYIDYDFTEAAPPSRVFRKFSSQDSLNIRIINNLYLDIHYLLLLEDRGILDWGAFLQQVSDEYVTHDGRVLFRIKRRRLTYAAGLGFYFRRGYHSYGGETLQLGEKIESVGPEIEIQGTGFYNTQISLTVSIRNITESEKTPYTQTLINFALLKNL